MVDFVVNETPVVMTRFSEYIRLGRTGRIVVVEFDRGDGLNALSTSAMRQLTDVANHLAEDDDSSAIVLHGVGAFSAGADLKERTAQSTTLMQRRTRIRIGPDMCAAWERLEQITITAIERFCIGGGVALVMACDHRITGHSTQFRLPEVPLGMNMSWQSNPRTVALMGASRAKRFTILGEKLDGERAVQWGLADESVADGEALENAMILAARYAQMPPLPLRMTKQAINATANALNLATSFMDRDQFLLAAATEDQKEGVRAFLEKRKPEFRGE